LRCKSTFEKKGAKLMKIFFTNSARKGEVRGFFFGSTFFKGGFLLLLHLSQRWVFAFAPPFSKVGFSLAPPFSKVDIK